MKIYSFAPTWMAIMAVCFATGSVNAQRVFMVVDRATGDLSAVSSADLDIDGYSVSSPSGRLNPDNWNSLTGQGADGWSIANPRSEQLTELNLSGNGSLVAGQRVSLGNAYNGVGLLPEMEDISFQYSTPAGELGTASVVYMGNPQVPGLTVDRVSGAVEVINPLGFELTGYSILSSSESLNPGAFTSLTDQGASGWTVANPQANRISELSLSSSQVVDASSPISLGNIYAGGAEDLSFEYTTAEGELANGLVSYMGPVNDLTLQVDLVSGVARLMSPPAAGTFEVFGYSIFSEAGSLSPTGWSSLADAGTAGWTEANPTSNALAELNPSSSTTISGSSVPLGAILSGNETDLTFEYSVADGIFAGTVEYVLGMDAGMPSCGDVAASRAIAGDLDGDNSVGFPDFLVLSANFGQSVSMYELGDIDCSGDVGFPDFLQLSANFGQSAGAVSASSVPEPSSSVLGLLSACVLLVLRRRR